MGLFSEAFVEGAVGEWPFVGPALLEDSVEGAVEDWPFVGPALVNVDCVVFEWPSFQNGIYVA